MSKVSIDQLENIVLEGGGAKGAAYAGAIKGIEHALHKKLGSSPAHHTGAGKAILDYGKTTGDCFEPRIKRFAGSSAGAITSFALALGLNSEQITEVSEYPFKNFLKDLHIGKYRMIGEDGKIYVGEDKKKFLGRGDGKVEYKFHLNKKHKVHESFFKAQLRKMALSAITNIIISGLMDTLPNVGRFLQYIQDIAQGNQEFEYSDLPINNSGILIYGLKQLLSLFGLATPGSAPQVIQGTSATKPQKSSLFKLWWTRGCKTLLSLFFSKMSSSTDMNLGMDAIGNIFWDRGMFSGFAVREFFFDLMIFACLNKTHFQRCYFPDEKDREALSKFNIDMSKGRLETDFSALEIGIRTKLEKLPYLTFQDFFDLTGVSLILCVSNFTTDEPVFFSEYWTPNVPLMEPVGASMSIPPAIKPVYNESNAIAHDSTTKPHYGFDPKTLRKTDGPSGTCFDFDQFYIELAAIKRILADEPDSAVDVNSPLSISGHLTLLRKFLAKDSNRSFKKAIPINGSESITIDYQTMIFHYNVAYKGLLLDGGYRCNIPYNIFRTEMADASGATYMLDPDLKKTVAIKLDGSFPREIVHRAYKSLSVAIETLGPKRFFRQTKKGVYGSLLKRSFKSLCVTVNEKSKLKIFDLKDEPYLGIAAFEHMAETVIQLHDEMTTKHRTPWNKDKSIVGLAGEGYSYGSESGQIRFLSDHENIVPLYSYGVGVYDFDLKPIQALVDMAKEKAEARVLEYFGINE